MELARRLARPALTKVASMFMLGDNASTHPSEMLAQLYKQHPYLGKYQVNLQMDSQDESLGYAYGSFLASNPTDALPLDSANAGMNSASTPEQPAPETVVRIPVIIRDNKGYSFDTYIDPDGKSAPLNEGRLASTLFSASPFALSGQPGGGDPGADQNFQPNDPSTIYGQGYNGSSNAGGYKTASASILEGIEILPQERDAFVEKVAGDQSLRDAATLSDAFREAVIRIAENNVGVKLASAWRAQCAKTAPHVITVSRPAQLDGNYHVSMVEFDLQHGEYPSVRRVSGEEITKVAMEDMDPAVRQGVLADVFVVITPATVALPLIKHAKRATQEEWQGTGIYNVMEKTGSAGRAIVLDNLFTFTGVPTDKVLVMSAAGASFQDRIAGEKVASFDPRLLQEPAVIRKADEGVFLFKSAGILSEPVELASMVLGKDGVIQQFLCEHPFMGRMIVEKTASVLKPTQSGVNSFLVPSDTVFIPLGLNSTGYITDSSVLEKVAGAPQSKMHVRLSYDGETYQLSGQMYNGDGPSFSKNAVAPMQGIDGLGMTLAMMGDTDVGAKEKIAACRNSPVDFVAFATPVMSHRTTVDMGELRKVAAIVSGIRQDLTKEAANLVTGDTVDSVLSLNFITPENLRGYVDFIPVYEDAVSKLAELLIGVRLGVAEVPEPAVLSAMNGVEKAIQGLKRLSLQPGISG